MKRIILSLLIIISFALCLFSCGSQDKSEPSEDNEVKQIDIAFRNYTDKELFAVKSLLENRMSELGIAVLGIGEDWVNVQVYELIEELESYLVTNIFPQYKSFVVRIEQLPAGTEIRPA